MPKCDNTQIARYKTARDWCDFRDDFNLPANACTDIWARAFDEFFYPRLKTRYLEPIKAIKKIDKSEGEGFSMMAILCTLVEFLESTVLGKNYDYTAKKESDFVYTDSKPMFINFLSKRPPFSGKFGNEKLAESFIPAMRHIAPHTLS